MMSTSSAKEILSNPGRGSYKDITHIFYDTDFGGFAKYSSHGITPISDEYYAELKLAFCEKNG